MQQNQYAYTLCCEIYKHTNFSDHLHQTEPPEELLHASKPGDVAAAGEGHSASGLLGSLRQDVLPIRGQGVHEAGSREATVARCVLFPFLSFFFSFLLFYLFLVSRAEVGFTIYPCARVS